MPSDATRSVTLTRTGPGTFLAENARGGTLTLAAGGAGATDFSPVELLLVGIAGCSGIDVDALTSRLAEPLTFTMTASGDKVRDEHGNHMGPITVTVSVDFPEGPDGDRARDRLPDAVEKSRDRLCTVSRTVQLSAPVTYELR
ncbi:OsmC family protein [Ornithinimicrobium pekingense]|uniref:Osmotically inducible protein C n=1 Tax=Ornithinimicrobium pekingense TaxID=384677 RepID=A0ABQ2FDS0_9MICO|nr:OsmC family protein [Ornithinimicrobium pekingense]GGK76043.1 osmotically inducible protein C [Ornithinimicrobium pekingense]